MLENRPIVSITLGYIIGIIMGLYCKNSIVFLYLILIIVYLIFKKEKKSKFKLISIRRYSRYVKIIFTPKVLKIIIISSIISNSIVLYQNHKYENLYKNLDNQDIIVIAKVVSNKEEKEYKNVYKIKIKSINGQEKYINTYLYLNTKKDINLEYGEKIVLDGKFIEPNIKRNYKGFDYKEYLKTLKIYGTVNLSNLQYIEKSHTSILKIYNKIFVKIKNLIYANFSEQKANILLGLIIGYKDGIDDKIKEKFSDSNISHILAISGMHMVYITICIQYILNKLVGRRKGKVLTVLSLLCYMFIVGFSPSVVRAGIMVIISIMSEVFYKKNDTWNSLSISLLILLIYNPFLIKSISVLLSFAGTIGILVLRKNIKSITLVATLFILPIMSVCFNTISITSLITSIMVGWIIGPIIILGFVFIIFWRILELLNLKIIYVKILEILLGILIKIASIGSEIPLNKIYVITPNIIQITLFYSLILLGNFLYTVYHEKNEIAFYKRIKNLISLAKYKYREKKKKIISIILIMSLSCIFIKIVPKNLKIYFIDVGQGDSTLIVTPLNKKILIDGGGNELGDYDVGKNTLLPYLLDRGIKKLDYIVVSHFDTDHVQGLIFVMKNLKVNKVIIAKQSENSGNYKKFVSIIKEKNIEVNIVKAGDKINIEKNLYFDVLWPDCNNIIIENAINNNAIVCKLVYGNFSLLFTGDIEEKAEKNILELYKKESNVLKSSILKVAHHGSKTSSSEEFLMTVKPMIALIGVGKNNLYGHPASQVIDRLNKFRYRSI